MTSRQLLSLAQEVTRVTNPESPFGKLLRMTAADFDKIVALIQTLISTNLNTSEHNTTFTSLVNQASKTGVEMRRVRLLELFSEVATVKDTVRKFLDRPSLSSLTNAAHTLQLIDNFTTDLENYWRNHRTSEAFVAVVTATRLLNELQTLRTAAAIIESSLAPAFAEMKAGEETLSLYLSGNAALEDFGKKLTSVAHLYSEFCELLEVSTAEYPLKIVKIESGTTWLQIIGSAPVIQFIILAIGNVSIYLYRTYTREGEMSKIPKNVEEITSLLKLEEEMSKRGIDTAPLKERILKASVKVSDNLVTLLRGEDSVEVNDTLHPLTPDSQRRMIGRGKMLTLQENTVEAVVLPNPPTDPARG